MYEYTLYALTLSSAHVIEEMKHLLLGIFSLGAIQAHTLTLNSTAHKGIREIETYFQATIFTGGNLNSIALRYRWNCSFCNTYLAVNVDWMERRYGIFSIDARYSRSKFKFNGGADPLSFYSRDFSEIRHNYCLSFFFAVARMCRIAQCAAKQCNAMHIFHRSDLSFYYSLYYDGWPGWVRQIKRAKQNEYFRTCILRFGLEVDVSSQLCCVDR